MKPRTQFNLLVFATFFVAFVAATILGATPKLYVIALASWSICFFWLTAVWADILAKKE